MRRLVEIEDTVCDLYASEHTSWEIAEELGCSQRTVLNILRRHGVESRHPGRWKVSAELRKTLAREYEEGNIPERLASLHGISMASVYYNLHQAGVDVVPGKMLRTYTVNEHAFDDVETNPEAAYWFGFLLADGCVMSTRKGCEPIKLALSLSEVDAGHVCSFRSFLKSTHPLVISASSGYAGRPTHRIVISCPRLVKSLTALGLTARKSGREIAPDCLLLNPHFWCGCVDGDGYVSMRSTKGYDNKRPYMGLVGSETLVGQFASFVKRLYPDCAANPRRMHSIWQFVITGKAAVTSICELYSCCPFALPRKASIASEASRWVPKK